MKAILHLIDLSIRKIMTPKLKQLVFQENIYLHQKNMYRLSLKNYIEIIKIFSYFLMQIPNIYEFNTLVENQLYKKILKSGKGEIPKKGQIIFITYKGQLTNGEVFNQNFDTENPFSFQLGSASNIKGWNKGIATMTKGEKSILQIGPDFGYGKLGSGKIPANATLIFQVELLDFKNKNKERWQFTDQEKIQQCKKLKQEADQAFKKGDFVFATQMYTDAMALSSDLQLQQAKTLSKALWLNLSLASFKVKNYQEVIYNTSKVLEQDPSNIKAMYLKGVAYFQMKIFEEARNYFNEILKINQNSKQAKIELARIQTTLAKNRKKSQSMFSNIYSSIYEEDKKIQQQNKLNQQKTQILDLQDEQLEKTNKEQVVRDTFTNEAQL